MIHFGPAGAARSVESATEMALVKASPLPLGPKGLGS